MSDFLITKHALRNQRPCEGSITANSPAKHSVPIMLPSEKCLGEKKTGVLNPEGGNNWILKPTQRELCVSVYVQVGRMEGLPLSGVLWWEWHC